MSIIVEDGSQVAGAESYVTVAFCDTYHANRNNSAWASIATTALKEGYLRQAAAYIETIYRGKWKGVRVTATQSMDWPRWGCEITDVVLGQIAFYVPATQIPLQLQNAQAELALYAALGNPSTAGGSLNPNLNQNVISKDVGPIKIVYDQFSSQSPRYPMVDGYLKIFMQEGVGAGTLRLSRT